MNDNSPIRDPSPDVLVIWTIYDHPSDYPASYIARRFEVRNGHATATEDKIVHDDLAVIRLHMVRHRLFCIPRETHDDPNIIESWL